MGEYKYVIIGDSENYNDCLVLVCGTLDNANKCLERFLNNPNENDKKIMSGMTNFRIKEVLKQDCWWELNCD